MPLPRGRNLLLAVLTASLCTACPGPAPTPRAPEPTAEPTAEPAQVVDPERPWRGVALLHVPGAGGYGTPECARALAQAQELGVESVSLRVPAHQETIRTPALRWRVEPEDGETWASIKATIRQAHDLGLRVVLKPHVMLDRITDSEWRGRIDFEDPEELDAWWTDYGAFVRDVAGLAQANEVELLVVGVELMDMVLRAPERWRGLIAELREVYDGALTYAANWDEEYARVPFWGDLDVIGVQCFFPLSQVPGPDEATLRVGVRNVRDQLRAVAEREGKPLLLTEVGIKSTFDATVRPWEWPRPDDAIDVALQARAYRVLLEELPESPWLCGRFWWNWVALDVIPAEPAARLFTPQGKPAAEELRRAWRPEASVPRSTDEDDS